MALLFVVGLLSLLGQVVLLRELSVAYYGIELAYAVALGIWMLSTAGGALISRNGSASRQELCYLLAAFGLLLPLDLAFIRGIRPLFSGVTGAYLPFHTQILAMTLAILPLGFLSGLAFQRAARLHIASGGTLARAYGIESLGGLAGGLLSTVLLMIRVQNLATAALCALVAICCGLWPFVRSDDRRSGTQRGYRVAACVCAGLLITALIRDSTLDRLSTGWTHPDLVEMRDTPYGRLAITSRGGQVVVFENDALSYDTEGTSAEEFVHLAGLQHTGPESVLVLGGGSEGLVAKALQHLPRTLDYVELNAAFLEIVPRYLPREIRQSLLSPRVRIIHADPRNFLEGSPNYDLIVVGMPEPLSGQANRFYTREFFEQCARRANRNGIVAFRIRSAENFWTPQLSRQMASIHRAFKSAFPHVMVIPGTTNVFIGSDAVLAYDPAVLIGRLEKRGIRGRIVSGPFLRYMIENDRFTQAAGTLEKVRAPENTDVRPICYQYATLNWLSKFIPAAAVFDASEPMSWLRTSRALWVALVACLAALVWSRRCAVLRRLLLMTLVGFVGMALETVLLFHYQAKQGVLFQNIGLLLMSFMGGLALGAIVLSRRTGSIVRPAGFPARVGSLFLGGAVLLGSLIGWRMHAGSDVGLVETSLLLAASGLLVSGIFACAGSGSPVDEGRIVGPLYAADLAGGCLGSIIAGLVLIPAAGLDATAFASALLSLLCFLLL